MQGGYRVEQPDYYVVRLDLRALGRDAEESAARLRLVTALMARSASLEARVWAKYSQQRGAERLSAAHSMEKRYINLVGGRFDGEDIASVLLELETAGFGDRAKRVPGPLLRATHSGVVARGRRSFSHMPLQPQSTYDMLHTLFDQAHEQLLAEGGDPELDLAGLAAPQWGHHSIRRLADTVARQTMEITGATEQDIDITFGWLEAMYSHRMQLHYESRFTRTVRARVTSEI